MSRPEPPRGTRNHNSPVPSESEEKSSLNASVSNLSLRSGGGDVIITLKSQDMTSFRIPKDACLISDYLKKELSLSINEPEFVPLPQIKGNILREIVKWLIYHFETPMKEIEKPLKSTNMHEVVSSWDADFIDIDPTTLFELLRAAEYMAIDGLIDLACAKMATFLKDKSRQQIRHTFRIENDFTPKEEQSIITEFDWITNVDDRESHLRNHRLRHRPPTNANANSDANSDAKSNHTTPIPSPRPPPSRPSHPSQPPSRPSRPSQPPSRPSQPSSRPQNIQNINNNNNLAMGNSGLHNLSSKGVDRGPAIQGGVKSSAGHGAVHGSGRPAVSRSVSSSRGGIYHQSSASRPVRGNSGVGRGGGGPRRPVPPPTSTDANNPFVSASVGGVDVHRNNPFFNDSNVSHSQPRQTPAVPKQPSNKYLV